MLLSATPVVSPAIQEICESVVASSGFMLVEVRTQGKLKNLQVTMFHPQKNLSLDDCQLVTRNLYAQLEARRPPYFSPEITIEVQSPGIDRRLKTARDFEVFIGQMIEVTLDAKIFDLTDCFTCRLKAFNGKSVQVDELTLHPTSQRAVKHSSNNDSTALSSGSLTLDLDRVNTVRLSENTPRYHSVSAA